MPKPPQAAHPRRQKPLVPVDPTAREQFARQIENRPGAANTQRSLDSSERYWQAWYELRYGGDLPPIVGEDVIVQFLIDHSLHPAVPGKPPRARMPVAVDRELVRTGAKKAAVLSFATVRLRVAMLARRNRNQLGANPNPASAPRIKTMLESIRREEASRESARIGQHTAAARARPSEAHKIGRGQKDALTAEPLMVLVRAVERDLADPDNRWLYLRALRDRALLLFAFGSGGRRRSEVTSSTYDRLSQLGKHEYNYSLAPSKTGKNKKSEELDLPVLGAAADALEQWIAAACITSGPLFPHVDRGGRVTDRPLRPESVRNLVRRLVKQVGLPGDFSAHSLRAGYMTESSYTGSGVEEAMAFSGHKSRQVAGTYYRDSKKFDSPLAHMLDGVPLAKGRRRP